jgi:hypothetical protein
MSGESSEGTVAARRAPRARLLAAAILVPGLSLGAAALGDTPLDPPLRAGGYDAEIANGPAGPDEDVFSGLLVKGERLTVKVVAPNSSPLVPDLEVTRPDGTLHPEMPKQLRFGKSLKLSNLVVDQTGLWKIRVAPRLGTTGKYRLSTQVKPAPAAVLYVSDAAGGTFPLPFEALGGSAVSLELRGKKGTPDLASLRDPGNAEVLGATGPVFPLAEVKKSKLTLTVAQLGLGDGTYTADFVVPPGSGPYRATVRVTRPPLARGFATLKPDEPYMDPILDVRLGVENLPLKISGRNFASGCAVWFGDTRVTSGVVDQFGSRIEVVPPPGAPGSTVRVAVVNPDGQAFERPDYFRYVPPLTITDLVDRDGAPVRGAALEGGRFVRILGGNFASGVTARFGGTEVLPNIRSATEMDCIVPAHAPGIFQVRVLDAYLHDEAGPFDFEYKAKPVVADPPYRVGGVAVPSVPQSGQTDLQLFGTSMSLDDVVTLDGDDVATQYDPNGPNLVFDVPAGGPAAIKVVIRDRVGTLVPAPDLVRQ